MHDVVIVGAGLAGLSAARALVAQDLDVLVLEARDRVGGRTHTVDVDSVALDLGGQWLAPDQHRMHGLCREFGIETFPQFHTGEKILDIDGKISRYSGAIPSMAPHRLVVMQAALTTVDRKMKRVDPREPWSARRAARLDSETVDAWARRHIPSKQVREVMAVAARVVFGAEPAELSLLHFLAYCNAGGGFLHLAEIEGAAQETRFVAGAQQVALALAGELGNRVRYDSPVTRIEALGTVKVDVGGSRHDARRLIVALPPHLVQQIEFEPALPHRRTALQQRFPMGQTIKCHVLFDEPFWRNDGMSGEVVATDGPLSVVFDNSPADGSCGALLGFSVGAPGRDLGSMTEADRRHAVTEHLARWFGPRARSVRAYIDKDWAADVWTGGCPVASPAPGALSAYGPMLRRSVGPIHWAGTETAETWTGYMEGAVLSGERAAAEVLSAIG
ncbi:MAG: flavin monoamine oxidase family protein [Actinomycetota bacterium]